MAKQILKTSGIEIPVITTLHGTDITLVGKDASYEPVVTFSINQSDGVTAVSKDLKEDTYNHFDITKNIEVIPNFIDLQKFKKAKKGSLQNRHLPGRRKTHRTYLEFQKSKKSRGCGEDLSQYQATDQSAKLLLVGDGPERNHIETLCRDLEICNDVRFLGKLEAVEEVLSVADLFIMPSEKESFGLAALEAMACEVPVISSNTGGLPELMIDGKTGYMSDVGDIESMSKNALRILSDEHLSTFKEGALNRAREFDVHNILPIYEDYYQEITEKSHKPITR